MNEFVEQFLIEARELVAQATEDLLALEQQPSDPARLDSAFRAFHTLKGAAGIIDFDAMAHAMHAAEELLSAARSGATKVTPALISDALTALDQVDQWLEVLEVTGEPPADAAGAAEALVRRLSAQPGAPAAGIEAESETADAWAAGLVARHPGALAASAIRYAPPEDAFFHGEDPLARVSELPGVAVLEIRPTTTWGPLADYDPYVCRVEFLALSSETAQACTGTLADALGQVEIVALEAPIAPDLPGVAGEILQAQLGLLADPAAEVTAGRLAAAAAVVANLLRSLGREDDAEIFAARARPLAAELQADRLRVEIEAVGRGEATEFAGPGAAEPRSAAEPAARALRVDVERIDALVNLTGELAVAKNALGHLSALADGGADPETVASLLKSQHAVLDRLVRDLQAQVLNIRVLPMRHVFQRFPKLVREMAASLGKPARLVVEGDETEADKAVVEALFEPLLHVLRNALDHGVEPPEVRAAAGKPATAVVRLSAQREGGQVVVEVTDDGGGVNLPRVRELAAARGVVSPEAAATLTDAEALDLVFAPGFSTAGAVTQLSGRGVGMDAVRAAVERLGGRVTLESRAGEGARVRLSLPFTVLMTRILTVEAGGQRFGVPLDAVLETVRAPRGALTGIGQARAFVHRNRTLPVIGLAEALGAGVDEARPDVDLVIALAGGQTVAVEVGRVGERMEVMLKPLDGLMAGTPGLAGATLAGDGQVLLVLDLQELLL